VDITSGRIKWGREDLDHPGAAENSHKREMVVVLMWT